MKTVIGNHNYFMVNSHVGHDCVIGNRCILTNGALIGGHCTLGDNVYLSGNSAVHQFVRIGRLALLSGCSATTKDIPPFVICGGRPALAIGINLVGLRRAGIPEAARREIKQAYKYLYRSRLTVPRALAKIKAEFSSAEVRHLIQFIESSERGIIAGGKEAEEVFLARKSAEVVD